jgi:hypothetical protein
MTGLIPRMLNSPLTYPEALSELWLGIVIASLIIEYRTDAAISEHGTCLLRFLAELVHTDIVW